MARQPALLLKLQSVKALNGNSSEAWPNARPANPTNTIKVETKYFKANSCDLAGKSTRLIDLPFIRLRLSRFKSMRRFRLRVRTLVGRSRSKWYNGLMSTTAAGLCHPIAQARCPLDCGMSTATDRRESEGLAPALRRLAGDAHLHLSLAETSPESLRDLLQRLDDLRSALGSRRASTLRRWIDRLRDQVADRLATRTSNPRRSVRETVALSR